MADFNQKVEGTRIICDGEYGTIKYFGKVPPSSGLWYGVEWDSDGRGKHSGEHEGIKYFFCSHPGRGSFVRAKKLDFGVDVVTALVSKFNDLYSKEEFAEFSCMYQVSNSESSAFEEKLKGLKRVSFCGMNVSRGPAYNSLGLLAPNITELDLSMTLLCDWQEVVNIVNELPFLRELNVCRLRFKANSFNQAGYKLQKTLSLKTLVMNYMHLNWQQVVALSCTFTGLQELHASFNAINSLHLGEINAINLTCICNLNLEGNNLSDWDDVFLLQALPYLEVLVLSGNPLGDVLFPGNDTNVTDLFPMLKSLGLVNTKISNWSSINQLNRLQALAVLFVKCCPLVSNVSDYDLRQELIARVAKCSILNRSSVTVKERKVAEMAYLKKYAQEWLKSGGNMAIPHSNIYSNFIVKHPRYVPLVKMHGVSDACLGSSSDNANILKNSLVVVTIKCLNDMDRPAVTKKLLPTMTISKLKGLLQRIFKVLPSSQILSYIDQSDHEVPLDDDLRPLSFYSISSGDIIHLKW